MNKEEELLGHWTHTGFECPECGEKCWSMHSAKKHSILSKIRHIRTRDYILIKPKNNGKHHAALYPADRYEFECGECGNHFTLHKQKFIGYRLRPAPEADLEKTLDRQ